MFAGSSDFRIQVSGTAQQDIFSKIDRELPKLKRAKNLTLHISSPVGIAQRAITEQELSKITSILHNFGDGWNRTGEIFCATGLGDPAIKAHTGITEDIANITAAAIITENLDYNRPSALSLQDDWFSVSSHSRHTSTVPVCHEYLLRQEQMPECTRIHEHPPCALRDLKLYYWIRHKFLLFVHRETCQA